MGVNLDKPHLWKADIAQSVDMYNSWFMKFAPKAFRETRVRTTKEVAETLKATDSLTNVQPSVFRQNPNIIPTLRMSTCPPIARDRLIGLAGVPKSMVERMENEGKLPVRLTGTSLDTELKKLANIILKLADRDIFVWLDTGKPPTEEEILRAATIVADRLCGAAADPIIRNAQEARQLKVIGQWLESRGYRHIPIGQKAKFDEMPAGTYTFRLNIPVNLAGIGEETVNIPIDVVVMRKTAQQGDFPLLIEAKSAGDFTNVNKRRKEEAKKVEQLRQTYGKRVEYILFLCGYFDSGYLGYEAADGIDWVWEHRMEDLAKFGL
jgi:hypothetical protein